MEYQKAYKLVSCPDPPSGGCGEREKEGLGTRLHTNKDSKDGNIGQGSSLLLCHHYKATQRQFEVSGK